MHIGWPVNERPGVGCSIFEHEVDLTDLCEFFKRGLSLVAAGFSSFDKVDVTEFAEFCPLCRA